MSEHFDGEDDGLTSERCLDRDEERIPYRQRATLPFAPVLLQSQADKDAVIAELRAEIRVLRMQLSRAVPALDYVPDEDAIEMRKAVSR